MMCSVFGSTCIQVFSLQQLDEIVPRVKIVMSVDIDSGHIYIIPQINWPVLFLAPIGLKI